METSSLNHLCLCLCLLLSPCAIEPHPGSFRRISSFSFFPSSASPSAFWHEEGLGKEREGIGRKGGRQ
jgi:hypothetical protein